MKTYRVAIVGLGRMGSTIDDEHPGLSPYSIAAATRASDRLELVAGSDLIAERRDAFGARWGIDSLYQDYMEMIERERPDLVAVCTRATSLPKPHDRAPSSDFREDAHAEIGARVAEAGVPMVYLEKAISNTIRGADSLLEACRRNGTVFNSGVLRRFCGWADVTRGAIEEGRIGEPQVVAHFGRGSLMHSHVHSIDTISYLLGDPGSNGSPGGDSAARDQDRWQSNRRGPAGGVPHRIRKRRRGVLGAGRNGGDRGRRDGGLHQDAEHIGWRGSECAYQVVTGAVRVRVGARADAAHRRRQPGGGVPGRPGRLLRVGPPDEGEHRIEPSSRRGPSRNP